MLRLAALCFKSPLGLAQLKQQSSLVSVPCYIPPPPNNKTVVVVASPPDSCYQRGLRTHHTLDAPPSTPLARPAAFFSDSDRRQNPLNLDINRLEGGDFGRMISKPVTAQVKGIKPDGGI